MTREERLLWFKFSKYAAGVEMIAGKKLVGYAYFIDRADQFACRSGNRADGKPRRQLPQGRLRFADAS